MVKTNGKRRSEPNFRSKNKTTRPNPRPPIANVSPADCVSLPDIVLNLDETERFNDTDSEIEVLSQTSEDSDSQALQVIPSPTYCLNATSDVTTQRLSPRLSPGSISRSSSQWDTPDLADYRANPLATSRWSDSDDKF